MKPLLLVVLVAIVGCAAEDDPGSVRRPTWGELKAMCAQKDESVPCELNTACGGAAIGVSDACTCDCAPAPGGGWCCTSPAD